LGFDRISLRDAKLIDAWLHNNIYYSECKLDGYAMGDAVAVRLHKLRRKKIE